VKTWISLPSSRDAPHPQDAAARLLEIVRLVEHQVAITRAERAARD
jgi:hypothetical protein